MPDPRGWLVGTGVEAQVRSLGRCSVRPTACLHRPACSCTSAVSPRHKLNPVGGGQKPTQLAAWQHGDPVPGTQHWVTAELDLLEKVSSVSLETSQVTLCSEELKDEDRMTHNMTPAADPLAQRVDRWRWGPELSGYQGLSQPASGPTWEKTFASFLHGGRHSRRR